MRCIDNDKDTPISLQIILKIYYQKPKPNCVMKPLPSTPSQPVIMRGNGIAAQHFWTNFMMFSSSNLVWREVGASLQLKADDKEVLWIQMGRVQLALIVAQIIFLVQLLQTHDADTILSQFFSFKFGIHVIYSIWIQPIRLDFILTPALDEETHGEGPEQDIYVSYFPIVGIEWFYSFEEHSWILFSPHRWMKRLMAKHQSKITTATTPTFILMMSPIIFFLIMIMIMIMTILTSSLFIGLPGGSPSGPSSVTSASWWWWLWWWWWCLWSWLSFPPIYWKVIIV